MPLKNLTPQEQQADLIQRFLNGELDEAEKQKVEKQIADDPNFAEEVRFYRSLIGNMKAIRRDELASNLNQWYQEHEFSQIEARPWWQHNWYYAAAAIVAVLIACYLAWDSFPQTYTNEELYSEAFQPYPAEGKRSATKVTNLDKGLSFYNSAQYDSASYYLTKVRQEPNTPIHYALFLGIAFLENGNADKAIEEFDLLLNPPNVFYGEMARWYLAMAYLKKGNREKVAEVLREIAQSNEHFNRNEAKKLLKKLH